MKYFEKIEDLLANDFQRAISDSLSSISKYSSDSSRRGEVDMAVSTIARKLEEFTQEYLKTHITSVRKFGYKSDFASNMLRQVNFYKRNGAEKYVKNFYGHVFQERRRNVPRRNDVDASAVDDNLVAAFRALSSPISYNTLDMHLNKLGMNAADFLNGEYDNILNNNYPMTHIKETIMNFRKRLVEKGTKIPPPKAKVDNNDINLDIPAFSGLWGTINNGTYQYVPMDNVSPISEEPPHVEQSTVKKKLDVADAIKRHMASTGPVSTVKTAKGYKTVTYKKPF